MPDLKTALVTGATGVVGRSLVNHLLTLDDWRVVGVSRRPPGVPPTERFHHLSVDLVEDGLARADPSVLAPTTHLFHAAYVEGASMAETVEPNVTMLERTLEGLTVAAPDLRHVHLVQGTKYYGSHIGPFRTPARESDPRHLPPNFYYDMEDLLLARRPRAGWTWSASRPHSICGFSLGNPMNLVNVIAVYATICKELDLDFCFPGTEAGYRRLFQATDSALLARAMVWMATEPACADHAFNVINGDYFRWENLWPRLARYFRLRLGPVRPLELTAMMADKAGLWQRITERHGLARIPFADLSSWQYGDFVFRGSHDIMSSMTKARRHGFHEVVDDADMFVGYFDVYRRNRIIP